MNKAVCSRIWQEIRDEAEQTAAAEPVLNDFLQASILQHPSLPAALAHHLAHKLQACSAPATLLQQVISEALTACPAISRAACEDLQAIEQRDSACRSLSVAFLYFKGFHALQTHRIAHWLWQQQRRTMARLFQSLSSSQFGVDIHPAARLGNGIMMDHATGIVIGETATVGNNVSLMQSVTLGGTGKEDGDRHPKVGDGVLVSTGAKILGNIRVGEGAKVCAGSVVLKPVPAHTTVAGVPAQIIGHPDCEQPALDMNHAISCDIDH